MQIFIMRHGEAANNPAVDAIRPLTKKGIIETTKMGVWLAQQNIILKHIFVSPYLRAQQSCTSVCLSMQEKLSAVVPSAETLDIITPSGNANQVHDFIDGLLQGVDYLASEINPIEKHAILFVSHMPFVSYLVGELTSSVDMPIFSTGSVAVIDYDVENMQGHLVNMLSPEKIHL
jgi:phosphohistidine phosphatase